MYEEPRIAYAKKKMQKKHAFQYSWINVHGRDTLEIADQMNRHYAKGEVQRNIEFIARQIKDQERRVSQWKLTDLEPVNKVA